MQKGALVIGGGVAGVQSALDLANAGFKVFLVDVWPKQGSGPPISQVLTWGEGKYQFIGNYSSIFELDHTYRVVYVQKAGHNKHIYNNLIVLEWEEV